MAHIYAINDDVHHLVQGPQGRTVVEQRSEDVELARLGDRDGAPGEVARRVSHC